MLQQKYIYLPNGVGINYYFSGEFPNKNTKESDTICHIFLHGLTNNAQTWHPIMPFFHEENTCNIYIDLPGHGNSSQGNFSYDIDFYTETLEWFISELGLQNISLLGHSLGGQIAINYAIVNQNAIQKIVLIAPAGFETFTFFEKTMLERAALFPVSLGNYLKLLRPSYRSNNYLPIEQILHDRAALNVISKSVKGMLKNTVFAELSELELPVLVIFGENDKAIPNPILHPSLTTAEVAIGGAKKIRNGKLEMIPHSGHFVHLQHPETVAEKIHEFLFDNH